MWNSSVCPAGSSARTVRSGNWGKHGDVQGHAVVKQSRASFQREFCDRSSTPAIKPARGAAWVESVTESWSNRSPRSKVSRDPVSIRLPQTRRTRSGRRKRWWVRQSRFAPERSPPCQQSPRAGTVGVHRKNYARSQSQPSVRECQRNAWDLSDRPPAIQPDRSADFAGRRTRLRVVSTSSR